MTAAAESVVVPRQAAAAGVTVNPRRHTMGSRIPASKKRYALKLKLKARQKTGWPKPKCETSVIRYLTVNPFNPGRPSLPHGNPAFEPRDRVPAVLHPRNTYPRPRR